MNKKQIAIIIGIIIFLCPIWIWIYVSIENQITGNGTTWGNNTTWQYLPYWVCSIATGLIFIGINHLFKQNPSKTNPPMNKDFKNSLKNLVDEGKLDEVFEEIEENSQVSYNLGQFNSLRQQVIDGKNSTAFRQQIKTFIGTLKEKK